MVIVADVIKTAAAKLVRESADDATEEDKASCKGAFDSRPTKQLQMLSGSTQWGIIDSKTLQQLGMTEAEAAQFPFVDLALPDEDARSYCFVARIKGIGRVYWEVLS